MGVDMRKSVAIIAVALISTSIISSPVFAGQQKSDPLPTPKPSASRSPVVKPVIPKNLASKTKAARTLCRPTSAVGHAAKQIAVPTIAKPYKNHTITLVTNCGEIVIQAEGKKAPITVIAMTALAKSGFFDQSLCHRLTTASIFVLQCGDPTATGQGGPAFMFPDENLPAATTDNYPAGTVAMANSGPNTNGSQFFLVYADTTLGANYTIWGHITKGLGIVKAIAAAGVVDGGSDGAPKLQIAIESATVK